MSGYFKATPVLSKPKMTEAVDIRRSKDEPSGMGSEPFSTLVEKIDWICYVFDHVGERYDIVASGFGQVRYRPTADIEPIASTTRDGLRIRVYARNLPPKG